ncbi:MAG: ABC transporter substrate-binding protein, partial [Candidatus Kapabacteria bacterium]|nr:ABC transporter substrate-binding protein [Candidatus Kapabacteria bacterium]
TEKLTSQKSFLYNEAEGITSLDPAHMSYMSAIWVGTQLYNGLVEFDTALRVVPCLARAWSRDATGRLWCFVLRRDVFFHDDPCFGGKPRRFRAADVKFSFERICDARTRSPGLWVFWGKIVGVEEFHAATLRGERLPEGVRGIRVVDDTTVEIELQRPFAPFLSLLTMPYCWIVPEEAVRSYGKDFFRHPVGTGPFRLLEWQPDVRLVLLRNERYFKVDATGTRLPYLDSVVVRFLRDPRTAFWEFQQGRLDMVSGIDPSLLPAVLTPDGRLRPEFAHYQLLSSPAYAIEYYGIMLDTTTEGGRASPLARSRLLRQALNYAIDRQRIVRHVLYGLAEPAHYGVLPPGFPGFSPGTVGYRYDPQRARQLLAAAGFPNGEGLPVLTLQLGISPRTLSVAEAVQQQLAEMGIRVELRQVSFPQHLAMVREGRCMLWRTNWIADYLDPENFLALFYSGYRAPDGPNTTRVRLVEVDSLYDRALAEVEAERRFQLYRQIERRVLDEAPWIFLYYPRLVRLLQPTVAGMYLDGSDRLVLEQVRKR